MRNRADIELLRWRKFNDHFILHREGLMRTRWNAAPENLRLRDTDGRIFRTIVSRPIARRDFVRSERLPIPSWPLQSAPSLPGHPIHEHTFSKAISPPSLSGGLHHSQFADAGSQGLREDGFFTTAGDRRVRTGRGLPYAGDRGKHARQLEVAAF